jgi:hypothetical protein
VLSEDQLKYLKHHKILPEAVLDATRMTTGKYKSELARQKGTKAIAVVKNTCGKGHAMRFRLSSGHCMECSPQGIAHWKRRQLRGFVYIASSKRLDRIKIGFTQDPSGRDDTLYRDAYGGADDWVLEYHRYFDKAGTVEDFTHSSLAMFSTPIPYIRRGHQKQATAKEIFNCDCERARAAIERHAEGYALGNPWDRLPRGSDVA